MGAAVKRLPAEDSNQCSEMHRTVCIVDDNQDVREVLARIVRTVGLEPELYDSAEAFLRRRDGSRIGCLLLDVQLGGMSGLELLAQLSDKRVGYPVFLISGLHDAHTVAQAKAFKAIVVDKPFDARKLAQRVLASVSAPPA
jgi:FixJ family two-component response regulator